METNSFNFQTKKLSKKERSNFYLLMAERCFNNIEINKQMGCIHSENIQLTKYYFKEIEKFFDKEWSSTSMNFNMTDPEKVEFVMIGFLLLHAITF